MDTEIYYKYKDGLHDDIKSGMITMDTSIKRKYVDGYNTHFNDSVIDSLPRRLWNCSLVWDGDHDCKQFLKDLQEFCLSNSCKYEYEDEFRKTHDFLMKQELVQIKFTIN